MTEEELRRYAQIGIRAEVNTTANLLLQQIELVKQALLQGSGVYVRSRFKSHVESLISSAQAFDQAMARKEAS